MNKKQEDKHTELNSLIKTLSHLLDGHELKSDQAKSIVEHLLRSPDDFPLEDLSENVRRHMSVIHGFLTHPREDVRVAIRDFITHHYLNIPNLVLSPDVLASHLQSSIPLSLSRPSILTELKVIDLKKNDLTESRDSILKSQDQGRYDLRFFVTTTSDFIKNFSYENRSSAFWKYDDYTRYTKNNLPELMSTDEIEHHQSQATSLLDALEENIRDLTQIIIDPRSLSQDQFQELIKSYYVRFNLALPYISHSAFHAKNLQQRWFVLEKRMLDGIGRWYLNDNDPHSTIGSYCDVSEGSPYYLSMRFEAFLLAYSNYRSYLTSNEAFFEALPLCIGTDGKLLMFDNERDAANRSSNLISDKNNQVIFDSYLLTAANIKVPGDAVMVVTSEQRMLLLQYARLVFEGIPVQARIVSSSGIDHYQKIEINSLADLMMHCGSIKATFEAAKHTLSDKTISAMISRLKSEQSNSSDHNLGHVKS